MSGELDSDLLEPRTEPERNAAEQEPFPPERLERIAHRCGVMRADGTPCPTWTLQHACLKHRGAMR